MAHLRLVRGGGPSFISECVEAVCDLGPNGVLSPPLPRSAQKTWIDAHFEPHADLALFRRTLDHIPPPGHLVRTGDESDLDEALRIDTAAFEDFWQFDRRAILEALSATPRSIIHVVGADESRLAGFSVTGVGSTIAYLQRVAVDPAWQGRGIGRSLIRTAARWAKKEGAHALMLNTQVDNEGAIGLYESEGFEQLREPLAVLHCAAT